jgi:hypothetical protein
MQRNLHNPWTPDADQQLREMVLRGKSVHAISARLKRTLRAVRSRAHLLGLSVAIQKAVRDQRNAARCDAEQKAVDP